MKEYEQNPPPITGFKISRLQYILHLVMSHKQKKYTGSWSVLNMAILQSIVPRANEYLNFLKEEDIIEWKNYSAGRNSRLYRLRKEGKTEFRTITDPQLILRIEASRKDLKRHNSKMYSDQDKTIHQVEIDIESAVDAIEEEHRRDPNEGRRNFLLAEVLKIYNGEIFITVNTTNYRLDSNFTRLPSYLSEFLSLDGRPLVELDITNSQPFFAATMFNPTPEIEAVMTKYLGKSFTMYTISLQLHKKEDVKLYTSLVCAGTFYEFMGKRFQKNNIPYKNRKDLKRQLFVVFFGKAISYKYNDAANIFRETFPNVHRLFYVIKEEHHNKLAILLQRIESHVMLKKVVPRIKDEFKELSILTRHDSIQPFKNSKNRICFGDGGTNTFEIGKIMLDEIEKVTGLRPNGKAKRFPRNFREAPLVNNGSQ